MNLHSCFLSLLIITSLTIQLKADETTDLFEALNNSNTDSSKVDILLKFGDSIQDGQPKEATKYYQQVLEISIKHESEFFKLSAAKAYNRLGIINTMQSNISKAIQNYEYSLALFKSLANEFPGNQSYKEGVINILANMGSLFYHQKNYEKALAYWKSCLKTIRVIGLHYSEALLLNNIGIIHKEIFNYSEALNYYKMALEIFRAEDSPKDIAMCYTNMGEVYSAMGQHQKALEILEESLQIKERLDDKNGRIQCLYSIAEVYFAINDYEKASDYAMQSLRISKEVNNKNSIANAYEMISECYAKMGNYQEAFETHKLFKAMNDSVFNAENQQRLLEMEKKFESVKKEKELELLKEKEEHQQTAKEFLIAGIIFVSIIFILFILWIVTKRKREKAIYEKDILLHEQERQLMNSELEKKELRTKELNSEIEFKTKQLTTHALNIMQKNKMLYDLQNSIDEISKLADSKTKPELRNLKLLVKRNLKTDKDWEVFKLYFEQVNEDFFTKLQKRNPDLNHYDLRQCALIKLNMNIKESASVLNLSPNSIKSARYRLKKKLGLNQADDLFEYIRNI